jgi:hypothetical protein
VRNLSSRTLSRLFEAVFFPKFTINVPFAIFVFFLRFILKKNKKSDIYDSEWLKIRFGSF